MRMTDILQDRFQLARQASRREPAADAALRKRRLDDLRRLVLDNRSAFVSAISADFGVRSQTETELLEIVPLMNSIRHARWRLGRWMRNERRHVDITFQPARAWIRYDPLLLSLGPVVDAFAAGNRVMIKPSELTPQFSDLLASVVAERFDASVLSVIPGDVAMAQQFSALPFDHLVFTGSTQVGRVIMRAAAENLTPVTLELGGKSPVIVADDYPIETAARSIAFGKFLNAGQTCIAPDYALVPAAKAEAFAQSVLEAAQRAYPTIQDNGDYSSVINDRRLQRLQAGLDEARARGATILQHPDSASGMGKIAPTLVLNAPADSILMTEEIFGPILPVVGYQTLDEALAIIARQPRPLALYAFSKHRQLRNRILAEATSGGVTMNGTVLHIAQNDLPFGGVGASGMGAYHGREGFKRFSHARAVHEIGPWNVFERLGPPWGGLARLVGRVLMR